MKNISIHLEAEGSAKMKSVQEIITSGGSRKWERRRTPSPSSMPTIPIIFSKIVY